jgi:RimJ/RimL family protein N-acetyltransferase
MQQGSTIRTERLDVRPLKTDDLEAFHRLWSDPEVIFWGASGDLASSERLLSGLLARTLPGITPSGWFAVVRRSDGAFVGDVVLQPAPWSRHDVEIGWHTMRVEQRKGYATEAARGLLDHARAVGIRSVSAVILPRNLASQSVAVRIGMRRTGMVDHAGRLHDLWRRELSDPRPPAR